jgi:hypothetical protein
VVALVTGHGLKTREVLESSDGAGGFTDSVIPVRPNIDALEDALAERRPGLITPA